MGSKSPLATQPNLTPNADLVRAADTYRHLRPAIHFTPPYGWMNDPCAVGYDPATGLYHLFFQWNPHSCSWGDISWGHRVSTDLLRWTSLADPTTPALRPDQPYDCKGVFSGCFLPRGVAPADAAGLTVFYTAVRELPIHWSVPYARGCESLAVATSADGGRSWRKLDRNPILAEEPAGLDVTGWRDPHVGAWPGLDAALRGAVPDRPAALLYGLISGGIRGRGPTAFFYAVDAADLTRWTYLGPLVDLPARFRASPRWSGDFGVNWECTNFMTLTAADGGSSRDFLVTGAEGGAADPSADNNDAEASPVTRRCLWLSGRLVTTDENNIRMRHLASGVLDHGGLYAANTFHDPIGNRRILWGWLPEDDEAVPVAARERKGWTGCLGLPRELFLLTIPRVRAALRSPLEALTCMEMEAEDAGDGTFTLRTLGIRPLPALRQLRRLPFCKFDSIPLPSQSSSIHPVPFRLPYTFELKATLSFPRNCSRAAGLLLHHPSSPSSSSSMTPTKTSITFSPTTEEISLTHTSPRRTHKTHSGPFTLFTLAPAPADAGEPVFEPVREPLRLHLFADGHVLELFANERFAMSVLLPLTVTDEGEDGSEGKGEEVGEREGRLELWVDGGDGDEEGQGQGPVLFEEVEVWGLDGGGGTGRGRGWGDSVV